MQQFQRSPLRLFAITHPSSWSVLDHRHLHLDGWIKGHEPMSSDVMLGAVLEDQLEGREPLWAMATALRFPSLEVEARGIEVPDVTPGPLGQASEERKEAGEMPWNVA